MIIKPDIKKFFSENQPLFNQLMALKGKLYRELENRRTQRVVIGDDAYFIKQHFGVGWKEIFKNLFQLRWPVLSAKNEWRALQLLKQLNIAAPEIVAYGCRGINPARRQSFLLTRELPEHISLEDLCKNWLKHPPSFQVKKQLITEVARIARSIHEKGLNHRDFYICHFLLQAKKSVHLRPEAGRLYLIDLHRAQIRKQTPLRWLIKDLAGLYFSSKDIGLTQRDLLRFIKEYRNKSLSLVLTKEAAFWQRVKKRGNKLYNQHQLHKPHANK